MLNDKITNRGSQRIEIWLLIHLVNAAVDGLILIL